VVLVRKSANARAAETADLRTTTLATFASLPPGRQLTSNGVVKGNVEPGQGKTHLDAAQVTR